MTEELAEELWDKYSEYVDNDVESLVGIAGAVILRRGEYFNLVRELLSESPEPPTPVLPEVKEGEYRRMLEMLFEGYSDHFTHHINTEIAGLLAQPTPSSNYPEQDAPINACPSCAERFKSDVDLEAHLFNNHHCNPK